MTLLHTSILAYSLARLAWLVLLDHMIPRAGLALAHLEN